MDDAVAPAQPLGATIPAEDCMNDDLVEKLRLLNYEGDFCKKYIEGQPFRPLSRTFFAVESENRNAQLYYFTSLASWLLTLCGSSNFKPPDQFADPNTSITSLLSVLRHVDIPDKDIAPARLQQGHGEQVLAVLLMLADRALIMRRFSFRPIEYPAPTASTRDVAAPSSVGGGGAFGGGPNDEDYHEEGGAAAGGGAFGADASATMVEDRVGDVMRSDDDDDDAEEDEMFTGFHGSGGRAGVTHEEPTQPQVPAEVWQLEVERVGPLLQSVIGLEARDWRARVEGALTLMRAVDSMYPEVRAMLDRVGDDIDKSLDKIRQREQHLGVEFQQKVEEYRQKLHRLNALQDDFNTASSKVSGLSSELSNITATLDEVTQEIADLEHQRTDQTPLVRIREAVARVRAEIKEMSLRIGVLQHTVLHYALRQQKERKRKQMQGIAAAAELHDYNVQTDSPSHGRSNSGDMMMGGDADFSGYM